MTDEAQQRTVRASPLEVRQVGVFCGAEIRGLDLREPLAEDVIEQLRTAHAEYGVLVFPDQDITAADLKRFGRCFGELSVHPFSTSSADAPELIVYDNKAGNPPLSTDVWHSDETFRECPPMGTMLCAKIIPEVGGDTAFASMTAVYEGLSDRMQRYVSGLEAIHDFRPFRVLFDQTVEGRRQLRHFEDLYPPIVHPVVRVNPVTGRKAIFVNPQFTVAIKGMDETESRFILDYLYQRTLIHEYHYRHRWQPNMLVFWDNRWVQHSALHDYYPQRRMMERVTIAGDRPVGDGPPADPADLRRSLMPEITDFTASRARRLYEGDN